MVEWGKKEDIVRALILIGSRAGRRLVDNFSNYDLSVFCSADASYTGSESWLIQFGSVLVCIKEKIFYKGKAFPSLLVIFESRIKVDFSFLSLNVLDEIVQSSDLPDDYNLGYKIFGYYSFSRNAYIFDSEWLWHSIRQNIVFAR